MEERESCPLTILVSFAEVSVLAARLNVPSVLSRDVAKYFFKMRLPYLPDRPFNGVSTSLESCAAMYVQRLMISYCRRIQTNATVAMSNNNQTATLSLGGETLVVQLLSPSGAAFYTQPAVREATDPILNSDALSQDQPNAPAQILTILLDTAGAQTIEVLFKFVFALSFRLLPHLRLISLSPVLNGPTSTPRNSSLLLVSPSTTGL